MARKSGRGTKGVTEQMGQSMVRGHMLALVTVLVWGVTFVSTKVLLVGCSPIEILVFRFAIGYVALWLLRPRIFHTSGWREEAMFAAAGACGVTLYFLMENIALTLTTASNVGVIVATAPLFTGLIASLVLKEGRLSWGFFAGFVLAIGGIALISFAGGSDGVQSVSEFGLVGCLLSLLAAAVWSVYANISKHFSERGFDTILATRRTFFWGLLFMVPCAPMLGFSPDWSFVFQPQTLGNLLFLGLVASASCYVTWNAAVKRLGPIRTSAYIYLTPVITIASSVVVLGEPLTVPIMVGAVLTIVGLVVSELRPHSQAKPAEREEVAL